MRIAGETETDWRRKGEGTDTDRGRTGPPSKNGGGDQTNLFNSIFQMDTVHSFLTSEQA